MSQRQIISAVLFLSVSSTSFGLVSAALAQAGTEALQSNSIHASPDEARSVYWNKGKLQNSAAMPTPVLDKAARGTIRKTEAPGRGDAPPQDPPDAGSRPSTRSSGDVTARPLWWAGRLYFVTHDGKESWCSAQLVAPNVVLTAAHCVQDHESGKWHTNIAFYHQYARDDWTRVFKMRCMAAWPGWVTEKDGTGHWAFDYAAIMIDNQNTGHFGWKYGWRGAYQQATKIGYPASIKSGEIIQVDAGKVSFLQNQPGIVALDHENPRSTFGSSGGAWVADYSAAVGKNNFVIGVNSFVVGDDLGVMYSPYLDKGFLDLLTYVGRGCK